MEGPKTLGFLSKTKVFFIFQEDDLVECLMQSLLTDNILFIDLLLENGCSLENFTVDQLNRLYSITVLIIVIGMNLNLLNDLDLE